MRTSRSQGGATYLLLLFAVAILSIGVAAAGSAWSFKSKRTREDELIHIGQEYRRAIGAYYENSPGLVKRYPTSLDDLILDRRYVYVKRYLRKKYVDPLTETQDWGEVRAPDGGIMGVYSKSDSVPIRAGKLVFGDDVVRNRYVDWKFIYTPV